MPGVIAVIAPKNGADLSTCLKNTGLLRKHRTANSLL